MMKKKAATPRTTQHAVTESIDALARLHAEHGSGLSAAQLAQTRLPLRRLCVAAHVFQPRETTNGDTRAARHVQVLAGAVSRTQLLDPIQVFAIAGTTYVVDGHCRLDAYRKAGLKPGDKVPVRYLRGTFHDALLLSAAGNSKDKLPLSYGEKCEAAWRLVQLDHAQGCYTIRKIATASGVSTGTVHNMRKRLDAVLSRGATIADVRPWHVERWADRGDYEGTTDEDVDRWRAEYVKRLHKTFGPLETTGRMGLFAEALSEAYPSVYAALHSLAQDGWIDEVERVSFAGDSDDEESDF